MDVDEILALDRELTDEEFLFLESETLKSVRSLRQMIGELLPRVRGQAPALADKMELSANTMLLAMEAGAELPIGDKRRETAALKDLALSVRRQQNDVSVVRMPRRDRRRWRDRFRKS
jgi:hypothetical protein